VDDFLTYLQRLRRPVEGCVHRRPLGVASELATCALLSEITSLSEEFPPAVKLDACRACCEYFVPSPLQLNPVVASLVYDLTARVIEGGGAPGCDADRARAVQRWAEVNLEIVCANDRRTVIPARVTERCCYLGGPVDSTADGNPAADREAAELHCAHPAHVRTTLEACRLCRDWSDAPGLMRVPLEKILPFPNRREDPVVKTWAVGVTTAPRIQPTLEWCLDSLARAGWDAPRLFVDSPTEIPSRVSHLAVTLREPRVGAWPNYYLALAELLMRDPDADAYLIVQDDTLFYDRHSLREYLEQALWPGPNVGAVSLYCSMAYTQDDAGWHCHAGLWELGAMAVIFPRESARRFLADELVIGHRWQPGREGLVNIDVVIGEWAARNGLSVYYPSPSLTQHIGETSTLWPDAMAAGLRCASEFAGEDRHALAADSSLAVFPEDQFPVDPVFGTAYWRTIAAGCNRMAGSRAVICGLARDVAPRLPHTIARIERLGGMFRDYRVVIYENDSLDDTRLLLQLWSQRNWRIEVRVERLGEPRFGQTPSVHRTSRMAYYRNRCHDAVLREFGDFDYCLVVDTDLYGWSYDGIMHSFGTEDWDAVGSLGIQRILWQDGDEIGSTDIHFDTFALRPGPASGGLDEITRWPRGRPLIPVDSCFGGLCIYGMPVFAAGEYQGADCEHVTFHARLRALGYTRLFLNPNQVVLYSEVTASP
jgi:hypothetical protein